MAVLAALSCDGLDAAPVWPHGELDEATDLLAGLTPLATPCSISTVSGALTMNIVVGDGETAVISRRAVDNAVLVNAQVCGTPTAGTTVKRIVVGGSTGTNVVILDFANGTFAPGYGTTVGVTIDLVSGDNDALLIRGSAGADRITFGADGIAINGDNVRDVSLRNADVVTVSLSGGADTFSASGGYGTGPAYTRALTVYGGDGNDSLTGGAGADTLIGGAGNDALRGAADAAHDTAADVLQGGDGNDTFDAGNASNGGDTFEGGPGTDTLSYALRTTTVRLVSGGTGESGGGALVPCAPDDLGCTEPQWVSEGDTFGADIEVITGGSGDDFLTGGAGNEVLNGGAGNDWFDSGAGNDVINGGAGNDVFYAGSTPAGTDTYSGGTGFDWIDFSARTTPVTVTLDNNANDGGSTEGANVKTDVEKISGSPGNDVLTGGAAAETFIGMDGDDIISGLGGDDTFIELAGVDSGSDTYRGGPGIDRIDYSARVAALSITQDGVANDGFIVQPDGHPEHDNVGSDIEDIRTGSGDDIIIAGNGHNAVEGGAGDDTIEGGGGDDVLFGGDGVDSIDGGTGDDIVDGGGGVDTPLVCGPGQGDIAILGAGESASDCEL